MTWEYVAGFFDGEGNVGNAHGSGHYSPRISVSQAFTRGKQLLAKIQSFLALHGIDSKLSVKVGRRNKLSSTPMNCLVVNGREKVAKLAAKLLPYSQIKKLELQDTLRYMRMYPALNKGAACGNLTRGVKKPRLHGKASQECGSLYAPNDPRYAGKAGR